MNPLNALPGFQRLNQEEIELLTAVVRGNDWLRALLCTLARRGVAYRQADPARAREILDILAPLPYYKGGQFLFDLMEWEDFMLDGPPPPILPTTLDARALRQMTGFLEEIRRHLDGASSGDGAGRTLGPNAVVDDDSLPPLEPGLYLYQDVVLGVVVSILRTRPGGPPAPLRLDLDPSVVEVMPGEQAAVQLILRYRETAEDRFSLRLEGLPAAWYTLSPQAITLMPGARAAPLLLLHPPRESESSARQYAFTVAATSRLAPERSASVSGTLLVQPFTSLFVEMRPRDEE